MYTCWALLNRWISSMKSTVLFPDNFNVRFASSNIALTSDIPEFVALSSLKIASTVVASSLANVVFPHLDQGRQLQLYHYVVRACPGGPQRIMLPIERDSMIENNKLSSPVRCSWPTKSSRVRGLSLSASGADSNNPFSEAFERLENPLPKIGAIAGHEN